MIPYLEWHEIALGPVQIQVWGLFVAAGMFVGTYAAARMAVRLRLESRHVWDMAFWALLASIVGARLFYVLAYEPSMIVAAPSRIPAIWEGGMSVIGGFLGALAAGLAYMRLKRLAFFRYADAGLFGLPLGLFIGRIGCLFIHDHPGTETSFLLGVRYPDGIVRHDHGLYLSLLGLATFLVFLHPAIRKRAGSGIYVALFPLIYGIARFLLDFLRAHEGNVVDERYLGLTPAQYASLALVVAGIWALCRLRAPLDKRGSSVNSGS